uniref:ATP synthase F0 subunit 8 n=1 Tax=Geryonia proboscidalis TaxID=497503 RepID=A0A0S2IB60_9CNID|nr:ATP synthase F0 subunit 8 [Geryonia proboscidalis]
MPQLDLVTFFSQYCWALLSSLSMFVFVVVILIPNLKTKFKIRALSDKVHEEKTLESKEVSIIKRILQL